MLVDHIDITVTGGHGGPGLVSFGKKLKSGPDGGNGGKGGDIYAIGTTNIWALNQFTRTKHFTAEKGEPGRTKKRSGNNGGDTELKMPLGTHIINKKTGQEIEITSLEEPLLIAKGGLGGRGNFEFRSSTNTTPEYAQPGLPGATHHLHLELKLIAQFGLIGLPNASKSSLLNEITNAKAAVGDYPFTTLEPNLGVHDRQVIADIPGLIEGASRGKGLGIKFLKHIEKVSLLVHCISAEAKDIAHDYKIVSTELEKYNPFLIQKPRIILITKTDLVDDKQLKSQIRKLKKYNHAIYPISIHNWDSLETLKKVLTSSIHSTE